MKGVDLSKVAWMAVVFGVIALGTGGYVAYQALRPSSQDRIQQACERAQNDPAAQSPESGISADMAVCTGQVKPQ